MWKFLTKKFRHKKLTNAVCGDTTPSPHKLPVVYDKRIENILELPLELLVYILHKYVCHDDRLRMRLAHSKFQVLCDDVIGFSVTINTEGNVNEEQEKFEFISEVVIRKATVKNLVVPKNTAEIPARFFVNNFSLDSLFLYPSYLQELYVTGQIDAHILSEIIRKCTGMRVLELLPESGVSCSATKSEDASSNLQNSRVVLPEVQIFSEEPFSKSYLPNCKALKLTLSSGNNSTEPNDYNCEAALAIMKSLKSPILEKVVLQAWISKEFSISRITLIATEFLIRNPSLESFFVGVMYEHIIQDNAPLTDEDTKLRPLISNLLKTAGNNSNKLKKFGISTRSSDVVLWKEFLKKQNFLVHLSLTVDVVQGIFSTDMFKSCSKTLRQFILRGRFSSPFNFEWLAECHDLKEICLHNLITRDEADSHHNNEVHVVNATAVPKNLESFVLFQTATRTDDINAVLKKLKNLQTLVLFKIGNIAGETGVNFECLKRICGIRTLQSVLLVRFVASNPMEASDIVKILKALNQDRIQPTEQGSPEVLSEEHQFAPIQDSCNVVNSNLAPSDNGVTEEVDASVDINNGAGSEKTEESELPKTEPPISVLKTSEADAGAPNTSTNLPSSQSVSTLSSSSTNPAYKMESTFSPLAHACEVQLPQCAKKVAEPNLILNDAVDEASSPKPIKTDEANEGDVEENNSQTLSAKKSSGIILEGRISEPFNANGPEDIVSAIGTTGGDEDDQGWEDMEEDNISGYNSSDDDDDDDYDSTASDEDLFDFEMDELNFGEVQGEEQGANFQLILNLQNEGELEEMIGVLNPLAADNPNNILFGFVLDGVVDIMDNETRRSRWIAAEDADGHLTYTLKISID